MSSLGAKYSKFDKLEDSDDEEEEDWRLSEAEKKARREKARDEMIQQELDKYKEIDEKLKKAEKLPPLRGDDYAPPAEPGSWSEGRQRGEATTTTSKTTTENVLSDERKEALGVVEKVLAQLAADDDFQTDLKRPSLQKAIKHWTNEDRLPKAATDELFDEESFEYRQVLKPALAKISRLQAASKRAGIGVPMDAVLKRRTTIFELTPKKEKKTPPPKPLTESEKREKARKDFEEKVMADLPSPEPFSWRRLGRQLLLQLVFMACTLLYFHFVMKPNLAEQMKKLEREESSLTAPQSETHFPADDELDLRSSDDDQKAFSPQEL